MPSDDEYEEFRAWREWRRAREQAPSRRERTVLELWDEYIRTLLPGTALFRNRPGLRKYLLLTVPLAGEETVFGSLRPTQIDRPVYSTWVRAIYDTRTNRGEPPSPGRVENVRVALQACFTFHRRELGGENPLSGFDKQPGYNRKRVGYFTPEQLAHFVEHLPLMTGDILRVEFMTLQREATIRCLRKTHVDWTTRDLLLTVKGGGQERVVCPDDAFAIVQHWASVSRSEYVFPNPRDPRGRPLPYTTWRHHLAAAQKATGLELAGEPPRAHAARHGGARNLLPTTPLPLISAQLCHKDLKTTSIYLGVSAQLHEVLRASMNKATKAGK
jgi:hypothetical protein